MPQSPWSPCLCPHILALQGVSPCLVVSWVFSLFYSNFCWNSYTPILKTYSMQSVVCPSSEGWCPQESEAWAITHLVWGSPSVGKALGWWWLSFVLLWTRSTWREGGRISSCSGLRDAEGWRWPAPWHLSHIMEDQEPGNLSLEVERGCNPQGHFLCLGPASQSLHNIPK